MRIENWCGHDIRFVEINGHWYAILKDICDALKLKTWHISERLDPSMLEKVLVETSDLTSVETMSNTHEPVKKINKEGGKGSVYFAYPDFAECVAEYVVGNYRFAKWFKKKYPGTDLKTWLKESIVDEDGEYYDHSYGKHFDFEEWWKESFESEEE